MKEKLFYFFLQIDLFGTHPRFTINGEKKFKTYFGSFMTILSSSIISLFFIIYIKDVLNHSKPKLLTTIYNDAAPSKKIITGKDFALTLSLQYQNYTNFINEKIYNIKAGIYTYSNSKKTEKIKDLDVIKCNENRFEIIPEYFNKLDLNNLYCLKNSSFEIEGEYQSEIFKYLYFKFSICKNTTENNNTCESIEKIQSILSGGYIGMFMSDKNIIPNNFSIPSQTYGKNLFTTFSYKQYVDYWIYFKQLEVYTDTGYFFKSTHKNLFIAFDKAENNIDYRENDAFALIGLRQSYKREVYERSYIKIQEAAANAGGIVKIVTLLFDLFVSFFRLILYRNFLVQFFQFDQTRKSILQQKIENSFNLSQKFHVSSVKSNHHLNFNKSDTSNICFLKKKVNHSTPKFKVKKEKKFLNLNNNDNINNNILINNLNNSNNQINVPTFTSFCKSSFQIKEPTKQESNISIISALNNLIGTNNFGEQIIRVKHSRNCFPIIFSKKCIEKIQKINANFKKIDFLFDIVEYFKTKFEVKLLKNKIFDDEQREKLNHMFKFHYNFEDEKEGCDVFYKKKHPEEYSSKSYQVKKQNIMKYYNH